MGTKTSSRTDLLARLAEIQAEIAALTQDESSVNSKAVASLTAEEWGQIRFNMVAHDRNNEPIFDREQGAYKLVKGANVKDYMFAKGFQSTLLGRAKKGQPVELGTKVSEKSGHSQLMYATETIERLIAQGFVKADRFIKTASKKRTAKK